MGQCLARLRLLISCQAMRSQKPRYKTKQPDIFSLFIIFFDVELWTIDRDEQRQIFQSKHNHFITSARIICIMRRSSTTKTFVILFPFVLMSLAIAPAILDPNGLNLLPPHRYFAKTSVALLLDRLPAGQPHRAR
jgi:hypothetical protein